MRKITDFIVEKRYFILIIFIVLTGVSLFFATKVNINSDITKYLPSDSETRIGKDIMDSDFIEQKSSNLNVMFKNLSISEKKEMYDNLLNIDGVSSVDYDESNTYNIDNYTLYIVNVDDYDHSDLSKEIYNFINKEYKPAAMSGTIYDENKPILQLWIVLLAITMAMIILILMSESFVEPFLYLMAIGIAVFINKGTNIIFSSVSEITDSITAILQLALSMDYSIMLSNRYRQEREKENDRIKAMKIALYNSFKSISSSSVTTIVGLLALVFMSFTIGRDLGFVLAKGVLLSLISIFFCLPALLLLFEGAINRTKKKSLHFNLKRLGAFSYKTRYAQLFVIVLAFIASYFAKGNLGILYTGSEQDEVGKIFPAANQIAIVYKNEYEDLIAEYCNSISDNNVEQVLCYSNTINEKLAYNELNDKFSDLGQDTKIDEYLIKIIYYNYYKNSNSTMTLEDFITFIKSDIYSNDKIADSISDSVKEKLNLLENFTNKSLIEKSRNSEDLEAILGIDKSSIDKLMVLYNSKNISNKMSLKEFVDFMYSNVLSDDTYSANINNSSKESLKQLKTFTDKNIITKKMNSSEISNLFSINQELVEKLFLFYNVTSDTNTKISLNDFSTFTLNNVINNDNYSYMFDDNTISLLKSLSILSNEKIVNNKLSSLEMTNLLSSYGLSKDMIDKIYLYYAINNTNIKMSLNDFSTFALNISDNELYSNYFNDQIKSDLMLVKTYSDNNVINSELDYSAMANLFNMNNQMSYIIYSSYFSDNLDESTWKLTPINFVSIILNNESIKSSLSSDQINLLSNVYDIMNYAKENTSYSSSDLSKILNKDVTLIKTVYGVYDYSSNLKISTKDLINFILEHKDDDILKDAVNPFIETLSLAKNIIDNSNKVFSYDDLSKIISIPSSKAKSIYSLYDYNCGNTVLSPIQFVNLILNNKNNELLKGKIDGSLDKLNLVSTIMNSTMNNTKYSSSSLAKLLDMDSSTLDLIYSLYDFKNSDKTISLINMTDFILKDVINDSKYNSSFKDEDIKKLNSINIIMKSSLEDKMYNEDELYMTLSEVSDDLDKKLIELVYIYYGSINNYNVNWKLTVEEFVNYLYEDVLNDKRFSNFIDSDMKFKINKAHDSIDTAKKLLVSDKYSRVILNTKYEFESDESFKFVENAVSKFAGKDGIYVIGDTPMALEMSKSFNSELDFITILTMLFIFTVVAFTFKSILIPLILVLIIQCAVYMTMGYLSIAGGNVYFIALLIVQAILMGATIDYAIVYTSYYKESRLVMSVKDSIINAYNKSIHTILTSSSILIIVTLIVANFASAIAAKICETISQGTLCSVLLILLILPGVLSSFDKIICRKEIVKMKK